MNKNKIVVTAALPYANGPIHLGHMVEYIQADIYVRFLRLLKEDVIFICADDTHGTPIELKARELKITPEKLIEKIGVEHKKDFDDFNISFDNYYSTNSKENKLWSEKIFTKLKQKGLIYQKEVEQYYSPSLKRFLADRYIKGECPKCNAKDQYGDNCEACGATYKPIDLLNPYCAIDRSKIELRKSKHYFFKLSKLENDLKSFIKNADMHKEVKNYIYGWIEKGLEDWCISRDGPYFGFKIPGEEDKYFYVWLDAPIGYISSTQNYCDRKGLDVNDYWNSKNGKIIHFIGKDISYFHCLFWPAMLKNAELNLPSRIQIHGFLTVNKQKMSKSRGTFITARKYLDNLNSSLLRYYLASHLSSNVEDLDLSLDHFKEKINNELIANIANFSYRTISFLNKNYKGRTIKYELPQFIEEIREKFIDIEDNYKKCNYKDVVSDIMYIGSLGNKYFQENEPWKLIKEDKEKAHEILSFCVELLRNIALLIQPIIPNFSTDLMDQLNYKNLSWEDLGFDRKEHKINKEKILLKKIEEELNNLVIKEKEIDDLIYLKVGEIVEVKDHPNAEKLFIEQIDFGDEKRQIISGIKDKYKREDLLGKKVIVLCNLKEAKIRGELSQGMVLVVENDSDYKILEPFKISKKGEQVYFSKKIQNQNQIEFKDFGKLNLLSKKEKVFFKDKILKTDSGDIKPPMDGKLA